VNNAAKRRLTSIRFILQGRNTGWKLTTLRAERTGRLG
jgi:hypothetical protein